MDLHFPTQALQSYEKGDRITVELGLKDATAAASPRMESGAGTKSSSDGSSTGKSSK
jgi:hypothetical protein